MSLDYIETHTCTFTFPAQSDMSLMAVGGSPGRGCGRPAAGWTDAGPAPLGSRSRDRPPERRCPAASPLQSDTGSQNEASLVRAHWLRGPCRQAAGKRRAVVRQPSGSKTPQAGRHVSRGRFMRLLACWLKRDAPPQNKARSGSEETRVALGRSCVSSRHKPKRTNLFKSTKRAIFPKITDSTATDLFSFWRQTRRK